MTPTDSLENIPLLFTPSEPFPENKDNKTTMLTRRQKPPQQPRPYLLRADGHASLRIYGCFFAARCVPPYTFPNQVLP